MNTIIITAIVIYVFSFSRCFIYLYNVVYRIDL